MSAKTNKSRPAFQRVDTPAEEPKSTDGESPVFCLKHIDAKFDLKASDLTKDAKAAFAEQLQSLASMTWAEIKRSPRHAFGTEKMPVGKLSITLSGAYADLEHVLVFRYSGKLPMVGHRNGHIFHIFAIEREFGELYDHG